MRGKVCRYEDWEPREDVIDFLTGSWIACTQERHRYYVASAPFGGYVYLVHESGSARYRFTENTSEMMLSSKEARALAKMLIRRADEVEKR